MFYGTGKKSIPANLSKLLKRDTGFFAIWFYDDGYCFARDCAYYLCLGTVNLCEVEIARATLKSNFGLEGKILNKRAKGFCLYFPVSEHHKILEIFSKYKVSAMSYKLGIPS